MMSNDKYDPKTITHEIGHCLKLHHPFGVAPTDIKTSDEGHQRNSSGEGATNNVMDYPPSTMVEFWLWQWIIINDKIRYYDQGK